MKIFISWSGDTGKKFAKILHGWLPSVLQAVKPFFSPDDIGKGARWSSEVGGELEASQVGIIVVTRESLSAPWVMFEAGALSKNLGQAKVVPILVDVHPTDVPGPLTQFQLAQFDADEIKRVLRMLNSELRDLSVTDNVLESAFAMWWPTLEKQVKQLRQNTTRVEPKTTAVRTERDLLEEILNVTRAIAEHQAGEPQPSEREANTADGLGALTLPSVQKRLTAEGNFVGANLMNLNLAGLDLSGADLRGANLVAANLSRALLVDADLQGANLESAIMDGADVKGANISRANLWRASMRDMLNLASVESLDEANFFQVELNDADRRVVAKHRTLSISHYPALFGHYLKQGMSKSDLRELFLWTAHTYPGARL